MSGRPTLPDNTESGGGTEVPISALLTGMATAAVAGGIVGWALLPLPRTVAGLPLFAVAAVATTLWSGLSFLRRRYPVGVLGEGCYLMGVAILVRPGTVLVNDLETLAIAAGPSGALVTTLGALAVAGVLFTVGWRLDTRARRARVRRARRGLRASMSRKREMRTGSGPRTGRSNRYTVRGPSNRQRNRDE